MRKIFKKHQFFAGLLSVLVSVFLVSVVTYAATTISSNVVTGGTVTMESASTTNDFWLGNVIADDDDSLFFDASGSEWIMWDNLPGEFDISDDLNIGGKATSTGLWVGAAGTASNIDMANDIYVQGDIEIDGTTYFGNSTSSIATTSSIFIATSLKLEPTATPTSLVAGKCFVDNSDNQLNCYNGSAWKQLWE